MANDRIELYKMNYKINLIPWNNTYRWLQTTKSDEKTYLYNLGGCFY